MEQAEAGVTHPNRILVRQESQKLRNIIARVKRWSGRPNSQGAEKPGFVRMVRESFPELQSLVDGTVERRRSTRIPLDNKNSRVLRQSINNYQGQSTNIQDEIVNLERMIERLKTYALAVPASLPVEDEQMHEIEMHMKNIGCSTCKIRSMLKALEPRTDKRTSVESTQSTMERRGSYYNTKYTQYQTLAVTVNSSLARYKETIDAYYTRLVSTSEHRPMSYWVVAEDEEDPADTPLVGDLANSVLKIKQKLSIQEREIAEREKRIREWHKLLSTTFQSKQETDDDTSSNSTPLSYDIEAGLVKVHEYTADDSRIRDKKKKSLFAHKLGCSLALTITVVLVLLGVIAVVMFYYGGFGTNLSQNTTSPDNSNTSTSSTTVHIIQAITSNPITHDASMAPTEILTTDSLSPSTIPSQQAFTTRESITSTSSGLTTAKVSRLTSSTTIPRTVKDTEAMTHSATKMATLTNVVVTATRTLARKDLTRPTLTTTPANFTPTEDVSQITATAADPITADEDNVLGKTEVISSTTPQMTTVKQGAVSKLTNATMVDNVDMSTTTNTRSAVEQSSTSVNEVTAMTPTGIKASIEHSAHPETATSTSVRPMTIPNRPDVSSSIHENGTSTTAGVVTTTRPLTKSTTGANGLPN